MLGLGVHHAHDAWLGGSVVSAANTDNQMMLWCEHWMLSAGSVVCIECLRAQTLTQSHQPFQHEPGCPNTTTAGVEAWADLHHILDRERG